MLILVVSFAAFFASGAESGVFFKVSGTCSGGGQLCDTTAKFLHDIPDPGGEGLAQFTPGPLTCSSFRVHFFVDGKEKVVTDFVGPGGSTAFVSLGILTPGSHKFGVQAEGEVGGCNVGTLASWAGTVEHMKAGP